MLCRSIKRCVMTVLVVVGITGALISCQSTEKKDAQKKADATVSTVKQVNDKKKESNTEPTVTTVYYFFTNMRCRSCLLIEEYTKRAIEGHFSEQIKKGTVIFKAINIEEEQNKHFVNDYKLYTKSVIVSDSKEGKEVRWKNLDQVWMLLGDQSKFDGYIKTEIDNYLKG